MNDLKNYAWFYTRDGLKNGPVGFADLQLKAKDGSLDPRLDMVWKHGMKEWKLAGEIDGLFARNTKNAEKESLAPMVDAYSTPQMEPISSIMAKQDGWSGAPRRSFIFMTIFFPIVWNFAVVMAQPFLEKQFGKEMTGWFNNAALFLPIILVIYFGVKRLMNLGMSGWWFLGHLIPLLNFWVGYRSFACPAGYAYHKKLDGPGIFLAVIYWGLILLVIAAAAILIAWFSGAVNDPAMKEQLQQAMDQLKHLTSKK
jgi:uncharacterized membrane protein YhaH (DUF805 family)